MTFQSFNEQLNSINYLTELYEYNSVIIDYFDVTAKRVEKKTQTSRSLCHHYCPTFDNPCKDGKQAGVCLSLMTVHDKLNQQAYPYHHRSKQLRKYLCQPNPIRQVNMVAIEPRSIAKWPRQLKHWPVLGSFPTWLQ
jgi:hypothetical protein